MNAKGNDHLDEATLREYMKNSAVFNQQILDMVKLHHEVLGLRKKNKKKGKAKKSKPKTTSGEKPSEVVVPVLTTKGEQEIVHSNTT